MQEPDATPASPDAPRKRRRLDGDSKVGRRRAACQSCSLRKVKCDNAKPICGACSTTNAECTYPEVNTESITLESVVEIFTARLDQIQAQLRDIKAGQAAYNHTMTAAMPAATEPPVLSPRISLPSQQSSMEFQTSEDYTHLPPHRTSADTVLTWPIFGGAYPVNHLIQPLLRSSHHAGAFASTDGDAGRDDQFNMVGGSFFLNEERIPALVDNFLENVHTKNPILDAEMLIKKSRHFAVNGIGWDAWSCIVLLACALGYAARPFSLAFRERDGVEIIPPTPPVMDLIHNRKELEQAENCFVLACRRLGLCKPSILGAQCQFFAGVYLMYTMRPLLSWQYFYQSSIVYQLYLKVSGRIAGNGEVSELAEEFPSEEWKTSRRQEQCLYWSCFKSECEFRVELPLPQSEIAAYSFPNLFPTPPSPLPNDTLNNRRSSSAAAASPHLSRMDTKLSATSEENELKLHAKLLCNEEESWYYYLTEIALRRIGNRIINTFFRDDCKTWMDVEPFLSIALEFETQISSWSANLPPAMQHYETTSTIRAPKYPWVGGQDVNSVSQELSWATENRLLEIRSWLYQPFLFHLIHARPTHPGRQPSRIDHLLNDLGPATRTAETDKDLFWGLIRRGIDCNLTILDSRSLPHRHHGIWYDVRATMCASLILLAVVKSGYSDLIPGGFPGLYTKPQPMDPDSTRSANLFISGGKIGRILNHFQLWLKETADMSRCKEVLEEVIRQISKKGSIV